MKETQAHYRFGCPSNYTAMLGVYMHMSEILATAGWTFWFDVQQRVGYWNSTIPPIAMWDNADPRLKSENGLVHIHSDGTHHCKLATTTPERLACILVHLTPTSEGWQAVARLLHSAAQSSQWHLRLSFRTFSSAVKC